MTFGCLAVIAWISFSLKVITCEETFILTFQSESGFSPYEWADFRGNISSMDSFTVCHWEKLKFFNIKSHSVWSYCTLSEPSANIDCFQLWFTRDIESAGRDIVMAFSVQRGIVGYVTITPFMHRAWNHFCWSYDSHTGENRIYANGKFHGKETFGVKKKLKGNNEVFGNSFVLGQEPDSLKGNFDEYQAFRGDLSELNMWNYILEDNEIEMIGKCRKRGRGNVISWDLENFDLFNISKRKLENFQNLCNTEESMIIFPQKLPHASAVNLCMAHGGYLMTPRNEEENQKLAIQSINYKLECEGLSGSIFWLGGRVEKNKLLVRDSNQDFVAANFTNWNRPLVNDDISCIQMNNEGKWDALESCMLVELCPVCGFTGTPVLTLKGIGHSNSK